MLVTFTELLPLDLPSTAPSGFPGAPGTEPAMHCGTAMELVTPAVGPAAVGYTFEPADEGPVHLPPVWRCRCGFQLDAWIRSPNARTSPAQAAESHAPHALPLSA